MKIFYKLTFCLTMLLFAAGQQAQSQVLIGDIAFTGMNTTPAAGSDDFTFIILKPGGLPASSVINFTDCGWNNGIACGSAGFTATSGTESDITWTSPASVLAYGTQVRIVGLTASAGTVTGTALSLPGTGDQIFAFTGARTSPTLIAGIHLNVEVSTGAANWDNLATLTSTQSNRPPCLTNGTYAIYFPRGANVEFDNAAHKCNISISTNQATALSQVYNEANWDNQDAVSYTLPRACVLPVNIITFQAKNNLTNVDVQWQVNSQLNVSHYEVERSFDNKTFDKIGTIFAKPGAGNINYSYSDFESLENSAAIIYYRLKSVDLDAKFSYSVIVSIRNKKGASLVVDNLTNPVKNNLSFTLASKNAGTVQIQLSDINGKVYATRNLQVTAGSNTTINMPEAMALAQGMYLLKISNAGETTVTKFIK
jgi:Secretion system C-terminal sorting domain